MEGGTMRIVLASGIMAVAVCGLAWLSGCEKPVKPETAAQAPAEAQPPAAKADASAGKATYDNNCAKCHKLGDYHPKGRAPNLANHVGHITVGFVSHHHGKAMNQADVDNLKAFIAQH
jgi:cytochrome c2